VQQHEEYYERLWRTYSNVADSTQLWGSQSGRNDIYLAVQCYATLGEERLRLARGASEKVADSLHSIGLVYQKLANFKDSIKKYDEALKTRQAKLGRNHLDVAWTLRNMGDVYYMLGDLHKAMDTYEESYEIRLEWGGA
jgi:tetratricopeptide (TPR) repeat protein